MNVYFNRQYGNADIIKFLAAIAVLAIHAQPIKVGNAQGVYSFFLSLAVPFFFSFSGFMMAQKKKSVNSALRKYLRLYIIWSIIYIPITIWGLVYNHTSFNFKSLYIFIRGYFLIGEQFFSWPLWYLLSLVYGLLIIKLFHLEKRSTKAKLLISICVFTLGYIISFIGNSSFGTLSRLISVSINTGRIFTGLSYLLLGYVIEETCSRKNFQLFVVGCFSIALIFAIFLRAQYSATSWFAYIGVPFLVILSVAPWGKRIHVYFCRDASQVIYFTHMIFVFIWLYDLREFKQVHDFGAMTFLVAFIGTLVLSCVYYFLKRARKISK